MAFKRSARLRISLEDDSRERRNQNWLRTKNRVSRSPAHYPKSYLRSPIATPTSLDKRSQPPTPINKTAQLRFSVKMEDQSTRPGRRGYLRKRSSRGLWQKRWFRLKNSYLCYFKDDDEAEILAAIDLRRVRECRQVDRSGTFMLILDNDAIYQLRAGNAFEAADWIDKINDRKDHSTVPAVLGIPPNTVRSGKVPRSPAAPETPSTAPVEFRVDATGSAPLVPELSPLHCDTIREELRSSQARPTDSAAKILAAFDMSSTEVRLEGVAFSERDLQVLCLCLHDRAANLRMLGLHANGIGRVLRPPPPSLDTKPGDQNDGDGSTQNDGEKGEDTISDDASAEQKGDGELRRRKFCQSHVFFGGDDVLSMRNVSKVLQECEGLLALSIGKNELGVDGGTEVAAALRSLGNLEALYLDANSLQAEGAKAVAESLEFCLKLKDLELTENNIGSDGAAAIADTIESLTQLRSLRLGSNNIGDEGAAAVAQSLRFSSHLEHLALQDNDLTPRTIKVLAPVLATLRNLRSLSLGHNAILADGAVELLRHLPACRQLKELDLEDNQLGPKGGKAVAECLECLGNLRILNLSQNRIGAQTTTSIMHAIHRRCPEMHTLRYRRNFMGEAGGRALLAYLSEHTARVQRIDISGNQLGEMMTGLVLDQLIKLDDISEICIGNNGLSMAVEMDTAHRLLRSMPKSVHVIEGIRLNLLAGKIPEVPATASTLSNAAIIALYEENSAKLDATDDGRSGCQMLTGSECVIL